jgi:hypothetical protein
MHPFLSAFLSLCLGDLATRLLFSPRDPFYIPAAKKTGGRLLVQMPIVIAILIAVTPLGPVDLRMALVVIAYLGVYFVNQIFWQSMSTGHARFRWTHLTLIGVTLCAADLLARVPFPAIPLIQVGDTAKWHLLVGTTVYLFTIFAGGRLIRNWTKALGLPVLSPETPAQLQNAGLYIGWLERFLAVTAISVQAPALVGLILTAKALARFPEFKEPRFAEYFLIGTLLSLALATVGGLIIAKMLYGTFSLK